MNHTPERVLVGSLQKFSVEDGPGIRTTIFLKGCPLNCSWCHNPELIDQNQQLIQSPNNCIGCGHCVVACPNKAITRDQGSGVVIDREKCNLCLVCTDVCYSKALRPVAKWMTIEEILKVAEQDKGFYDNTGGGITISGGEMLAHAPFVKDLILEAGKRGLRVCLDTCGFGEPNALKELAQMESVTDILYDMKSIDDQIHIEYTGVSNQLIIDNLKLLAEDARTAGKIVMRMPLVKGVNDHDSIIKQTGDFYKIIGVKRVHLLPYHSLGIGKQKNIGGRQQEFEAPESERMAEIEDYFKNELKLDVRILGVV